MSEQRLETYALARDIARARGLSLLEDVAVGPSVSHDYFQRLTQFRAWEKTANLGQATSESQIDAHLLDYFDAMFLGGESADEGSKLLAAIGHVFPELSRLGGRHLARSRRALVGWLKAAPGKTRDPAPFLAVVAIIGALSWAGDLEAAQMIALGFTGYLRPGEICKLREDQIVAPQLAAGVTYRHHAVLLRPQEE